jgi:hypothetical protein
MERMQAFQAAGRMQAFQTAAREGGFVEINQYAHGSVRWLCRKAPDTARETHERMCIDGVTNSVTVYWMGIPAGLNSKTFRGVPALQEWFKLRPQTIVQR